MTPTAWPATRARLAALAVLVASSGHSAMVAAHASRPPDGKVAEWSELYDGPLLGQTWRLFAPGVPAVEWNVRAHLVLAGETVTERELSRTKLVQSLRRPWAPPRAWRMESNTAAWAGVRPTDGAGEVGCGAQAGDWVRRQLDEVTRQRGDPQRERLLGGVARKVLEAVPEARAVELHLVAAVSEGAPGCSGIPRRARSFSVLAGRWERAQHGPG